MKFISSSLLAAAVLMTLAGNAQAATLSITPGTDLGPLGTMPGSPTDFDFLPAANSPSSVLTDFSGPVIGAGMSSWGFPGGGPDYSTIIKPNGGSLNTGIIYGEGTQPDMVQYTIGSSPTFNYASFNVYFMYGNTFDPGPRNGTITLSVLSPSLTVLATTTATVTDFSGANSSEAQFEEFTVKNAASGDILQFGATTFVLDGHQSYAGGVSFEANPVPEPSTWAMMLAGLAFLGFCVRRKGALVK